MPPDGCSSTQTRFPNITYCSVIIFDGGDPLRGSSTSKVTDFLTITREPVYPVQPVSAATSRPTKTNSDRES